MDEILLPGERGWQAMASREPVEILPAHWESFTQIIESVDIDTLRAEFAG